MGWAGPFVPGSGTHTGRQSVRGAIDRAPGGDRGLETRKAKGSPGRMQQWREQRLVLGHRPNPVLSPASYNHTHDPPQEVTSLDAHMPSPQPPSSSVSSGHPPATSFLQPPSLGSLGPFTNLHPRSPAPP